MSTPEIPSIQGLSPATVLLICRLLVAGRMMEAAGHLQREAALSLGDAMHLASRVAQYVLGPIPAEGFHASPRRFQLVRAIRGESQARIAATLKGDLDWDYPDVARLAAMMADDRDAYYRWAALFDPPAFSADALQAARLLAQTDRVAAVSQFMVATGLALESACKLVLGKEPR